MSTVSTEMAQLQAAITALEAQRAVLGDAVVEAMLAPAREKLVALQAADAPAQQRKLATVLFADVSGFTALSELIDAEEVTALINDLWSLVDRVVVDHGGRIDKHMGDAVMVLWGADESRENDPEMAIRAALAVQAAVAAFRKSHHTPFSLRIGINTGPVILGAVGTTAEFTAMGDAVNLASRLEHAAPTDGVLISHDTYRHVRGIFDVLEQEPLSVKGKVESVQTYVILRAKPRAFRMATRGVEGIETRMIGRETELAAMKEAFITMMERPEPQVVTIIGEAGVGKSRLLYEFDNWIELRPERVYYLKGRSTPNLQRQAAGVFRDLFAFRFDILDSDDATTALQKFRRGMSGLLDAEQADVVGHWLGFDFSSSPAVARLLNASDFGVQARSHLFHYLSALAEQRPVVLMLEDVHWADETSLDVASELMTYLGVSARKVRLLIICLARPGLLERRPNWSEGWSNHTRITLRRLDSEAGLALVDEILQRADAVPAPLRELIASQAEGNPFYIEEMVKMLIDQGVILRHAGAGFEPAPSGAYEPGGRPLSSDRFQERWTIRTERLSDLKVPATLTGLLQARLDALPARERVLLQRASVVGRLFWDSAVAFLSEVEPAAIEGDLSAIRQRELIYLRERSSLAGNEEYIFKHALLRDVTYETVLLRLRRAYHASIARWLEENAGSRLAEYQGQIAEHYALAGENERAAAAWELAGDQMMLSGSGNLALQAYQRAVELNLGEGLATRSAGLHFKLGKALLRIGDYQSAERVFNEVYAAASASDDLSLAAETLEYLVWTASHQGDYEAAAVLIERMAPLFGALGSAGRARYLQALGYVQLQRGQREVALASFQESYAAARVAGDPRYILAAANWLGTLLLVESTLDQSERYYEEAIALARELGDQPWVAAISLNLGNIAFERKQFARARTLYQSVYEIHVASANWRNVALSLSNLAFADIELGRVDLARQSVSQALQIGRQLHSKPSLLYNVLLQGKLLALAGDSARALTLYGLVDQHPATGYDARVDLQAALAALDLPPDQIASGLATAAGLELDAVVAEILEGQW